MRNCKDSYIIINCIFILIICSIFIYSLVYNSTNDNYPIKCVHKQITGQPCETCGLSHSFSAIARGRIQESIEYNRNGLLIFAFFVFQLIMRIITTSLIKQRTLSYNLILIFDIGLFLLSFVICFQNLIIYTLRII